MKSIICGKLSDKYFITNRLNSNKGAVISESVFNFLKTLSLENANLPEQLVAFLGRLGFSVDISQKINDIIIFLSPNEAQTHEIVSYEITEKCNFKCEHCVFGDKRKERELSTKERIKIIKNISEAGCVYLKITGGEPLLAWQNLLGFQILF